MAKRTGMQQLEESLVCSICVDVFTEPVTLACQHNFCRSCLQMFADHNLSTRTRCVENQVVHTIACPVCRAQTNMGGKGVSGLPVNLKLSEITEVYRDEVKGGVEDEAPVISVCEDEALVSSEGVDEAPIRSECEHKAPETTKQTAKGACIDVTKEAFTGPVKKTAKDKCVLVAKPEFTFTRTSSSYLGIKERGSVVEAGGVAGWFMYVQAWTGGYFRAGQVYWELEISHHLSSPDDVCCCPTGLVRDGHDLRLGRAGVDCWWVWLYYCGEQLSCSSHQGGEVGLSYRQTRRPSKEPQKLGVLLNCSARTLTFVDCDRNSVMCTMRDVDVSEPLIPAIAFNKYPASIFVSARLITGDKATLPQVLCDDLDRK